MHNITDLQEISSNVWQAKYEGSYGIYTINIRTDGEKIIKSSCSCPSKFYPCKHLRIIEKAIKERVAQNLQNDNANEITCECLLKNLSQEKLCDFIVKQTQNNPQFKDAVLLEFAHI